MRSFFKVALLGLAVTAAGATAAVAGKSTTPNTVVPVTINIVPSIVTIDTQITQSSFTSYIDYLLGQY